MRARPTAGPSRMAAATARFNAFIRSPLLPGIFVLLLTPQEWFGVKRSAAAVPTLGSGLTP